jgi:hypothetical protein
VNIFLVVMAENHRHCETIRGGGKILLRMRGKMLAFQHRHTALFELNEAERATSNLPCQTGLCCQISNPAKLNPVIILPARFKACSNQALLESHPLNQTLCHFFILLRLSSLI